MKVKAVVFDRDGTLIDSWPPAYEILKRLCENLEMPIDKTRDMFIRKNWGVPGIKMVEALFPEIDSKLVWERWHQFQEELVKKEMPPPLIAGVPELIQELHTKNILVGLLTSRTEDSLAREILEEENELYQKHFSFIQTYGSEKLIVPAPTMRISALHHAHMVWHHHKPNPEVFERILVFLSQKGVSLKEILYIGDSPADFKAARGNSIPFVGVLTGPINTRARWQIWAGLDPKNVIKDVIELEKWLKLKASIE